MAGLLDFLQGASNSAAANVSAPIDGLNWLLRKMGAPVSEKPFLGSDWLADKGLTAVPQNRNMGLLGEAVGGVLPMVAAAKAPQIAQGLLQMGRNAAIPSTMNRQAGMVRLPFGDIPENASDVAELAGKPWFKPVDGLTKRVMSDKKAAELTNKYREDITQSLFGHQSPNITYETATAKQKAIVDSRPFEVKALQDITPDMQQKQYLKKVTETLGDEIGSVHKNANLTFNSIPLDEFKNGQLIYKSPSHNRSQSSEYRLIMGNDGVPAYARKSNHFGKFSTNIKEGSPEAIKLGLVNGENGYFDPFGRVGFKMHNWELLGDKSKSASKAGAISLNDLIFILERNGQPIK